MPSIAGVVSRSGVRIEDDRHSSCRADLRRFLAVGIQLPQHFAVRSFARIYNIFRARTIRSSGIIDIKIGVINLNHMPFGSRFEDDRLVAIFGFVFRAVLARYGMRVLPCAQDRKSLRTASLNRYVLDGQSSCLVTKISNRRAVRKVQRREGDIHLLVILRQRSNIAHDPEVVIAFAESDVGALGDGDRLAFYHRFTYETGG